MSNAGVMRAQALLKELDITDISMLEHLEAICLHRGLYVKKEPIEGAEGRIVYNSGNGEIKAVATVSNNESYESRTKFSIAHEFGHYEIHKDQDLICNAYAMNEWYSKEKSRQIEAEANYFASEFLMPTMFVRAKVEKAVPSIEVIKALSDEFKTSLTASAIKYIENTSEACALVFYDKSNINFHISSKLFKDQKYWISNGPINKDTYAFDLVNGRTTPNMMSDVAFDSWVDISGKPESIKEKLSEKSIKEQSMFFPNLNKGISLLWAKDKSLIWN